MAKDTTPSDKPAVAAVPLVVPVMPEVKKQKPLVADMSLFDSLKKDVKTKEQIQKTFYWYGALPMVGTKEIKILDRTTGGVEKRNVSAMDLWSNPNDYPAWIGKCPWFQGISVRGCTFNAYSTLSTRSGQEGPGQVGLNRSVKAGEVRDFSKEQVEFILDEVAHTFVKPPLNGQGAQIYRIVKDPENPDRWIHEAQAINKNTQHRINPDTDIPVADYVYMIPIESPGMWPDLEHLFTNPPTPLSGR